MFFLPRKDWAPIRALPCAYMSLAKTFKGSGSLSIKMKTSLPNSFTVWLWGVNEVRHRKCVLNKCVIILNILDGRISFCHLNCKFFTPFPTVESPMLQELCEASCASSHTTQAWDNSIQSIACIIVSWDCCNKIHKLSGLEQQKYIVSWFWRLWDQCAGRLIPSEGREGASVPFLSPSVW